MLNTGFISPLNSSRGKGNTGRRGEDVLLTRQLERLHDFQHGGNRYAFVQTQLRRTDWPVHITRRRVDFEARRWHGSAGVNAAPLSQSAIVPFAGDVSEHEWLRDALEELADCPIAAVEEGLDKPSELGVARAEAVLRGISGFVKEQPDVYPMDGGGIVIDLRKPGIESSVLMVIEHDGAGALFYRTRGKKGRVRVENAEALIGETGLLESGGVGDG